jgi:phosphoribosylglycinamide formyltransferase-1
MNNIAIFASGKGSNMVQITRKFEQSESISVRLVVASRASAGVLEHAKSLGVESVIFTKNDLASPETLLAELRARKIEWLVLAGWL